MTRADHAKIFLAYLQRMNPDDVKSLVKAVSKHRIACLDPQRGNPDKSLKKVHKKLTDVIYGVHLMDLSVMDGIIRGLLK